jgi:hypothetical protein
MGAYLNTIASAATGKLSALLVHRDTTDDPSFASFDAAHTFIGYINSATGSVEQSELVKVLTLSEFPNITFQII